MDKLIYTNDHKYIVQQLKKARIELGLDQVEIAKLLQKTQSYISKIESGQRRIDVVQLKKLSKIYHKPITYFFK